MASFKNIRQRQDFDLSNFLPRALQYKNWLAITFDISKTFYNDWLSWCEIIKGFRTKFVPLSCNSQNRVFRLCLKTSLPHHTSRFLALNEWFFAFATNGDIQFGDKFRAQCTFVARTSIHYTHSKGTICAKVSNWHLGYCTKIVIHVLRLLTE